MNWILLHSEKNEAVPEESDLFAEDPRLNKNMFLLLEVKNMQITSFNPLIITHDSESIIKLFEELGFERRHKKEGINDEDITSVRMKDANGFHVDITQVDKLPQDMTSIRMNVRDFNEAYEMLKAKGFTNAQGEKITNTGSSISTMMVSPSGFSISIAEHIRKEDR